MRDMVTSKLEDFFSKFKVPGNPEKDQPQPEFPVDDNDFDPDKQFPNEDCYDVFTDALLDPEPELWDGVVDDGFLYFIDYLGFG